MTTHLLIVDEPGRDRRLVLQGNLGIEPPGVDIPPPATRAAFDLILDASCEPEQLGKAVSSSAR